VAAFDPHVLTRSGTVLLDSARLDAENQASWCFTDPDRVLSARSIEEVPDLIKELEAVAEAGAYVAGFLAYEAGYRFVDLDAPRSSGQPLAWFGVYESPHVLFPAEVDRGLQMLRSSCAVHDADLDRSRAQYVSHVETVRDEIQRGTVYQINYTAPLRFRLEGDPRALYRRLRVRQHVPYGAYLNLGDTHILSWSPELFFRRTGDRILTRPMKGTIRRGRTVEEDRALREELRSDPKNRAENLMIVDLLRNDLSVCCQPGSVRVPALYETEAYDTVTQMTSTVEGRLRDDAGLSDVLRALFPCGSVTGAPKRRAMRLIRRLETAPRGAYCGAIGMAGPDGVATFSVAIRTAVLSGDTGTMGIGSGIVWDSEPEGEYAECLLKGKFLTGESTSQHGTDSGDFKIIETMRLNGTRIPLLDRHVNRLARSAEYFSFPFDEDRFRRRIHAATAVADPEMDQKVRATLDRWGRIDVTATPLETQKSDPWRLIVAEERVDRTDPFFYHKTTARDTYDRALQDARQAGCDEALLVNREGEVTEGTYTNLFLRSGDELWTPPVESGLLAGVYREYVLETRPEASERVIVPDDLTTADALYCCNAVRGWCDAVLAVEPADVPGK